jgi:cobalt-precorrin-5B (C1)-methyltransferase
MRKRELLHGYTTGACAAAAAKGAALLLRDQQAVEEVELILPRGEAACFLLHGQKFDKESASCFVIKDAGSDPDVTHGAQIHAAVSLLVSDAKGVIIEGGTGIGRVTKPGLAVPVGQWAINPVPRRMIEEALSEVFPDPRSPFTVHCLITIPNGEELARKTLNARLGILGGLSILGTTGVVTPISAKAWTDTIDSAIDVALACGSTTVVCSTGRTSELVAQKNLGTGDRGSGIGGKPQFLVPGPWSLIPEEAFVMMGDYVAHALETAKRKGVERVILAGQFAKLLKIACGHRQTHVSSSELDLKQLEQWLVLAGCRSLIPGPWSRFNTARQVLEESGSDPVLVELVCSRAQGFASSLASGVEVKVLLAGYGGEVVYFG